MSSSLQQIDIDGTRIWVEVADLQPPTAATAVAATRGGGKFVSTSAADTATHALSKVNLADTVKTLLTPVHNALKAMAPDEANVELTLGFGVKGDLFVAKGEGNASIKISAKWKFDSKPA